MSDVDISYYKFDDSRYPNYVTSANRLRPPADVTAHPTLVSGIFRYGVNFDSSRHQYLTADGPLSVFDLSGIPFTITLWVKCTTVDNGAAVFYKGKVGSPGVDWALIIASGEFFWYATDITGSTTGGPASTFGTIIPGVWNFVCIRVGSYNNISLSHISVNNGGVDAGADQSGSVRNTADAGLYVGSGFNDGTGFDRWFNGAVDDFRIYRHVLSDGEVTDLYSRGVNGNPPIDNCESAHDLNGSAITDASDADICLSAYVHRLSRYAENPVELWYRRDYTWHLFPEQPITGPDTGIELAQAYKQPSTLSFVLPDQFGYYARKNKQSPYNFNAAGAFDPLIDEARKIVCRVGTHCYTSLASGRTVTSSRAPSAGPLGVLTDGRLGNIANSISGYVEFAPTDSTPIDLTVDLGAARDIKHCVIRFASYVGGSSGTDFTLPSSVTVALSTDGVNYTSWPTRPVGGNGSSTVEPGDWTDSRQGTTVDVVFTDLRKSARFVRFRIVPTGAQTIGLDELAIYGGNAYRVFGCNVFTGFLGDTLDFSNTGKVTCVAVDVKKRLADNNDVFLTAAYRQTSSGGIELGDIVYSLLTSTAYWKSVSEYDQPFGAAEIGWNNGGGLTGLRYPLWQGQTNSMLGYCEELFGVVGWNFYADGEGDLQAAEPPFTQDYPDRVCVAANDGCYDVFECDRHATGKQMRNRVLVQTGTSKGAGSGTIVSFEPNSVARYGTRTTRITNPLASTIPLRQKVADHFLRDYAWNLETLTAGLRPTYGTRVKQIFGFRAPAKPNLYARASTATGKERLQELWSLVAITHRITYGQWLAQGEFIPYVTQAATAPNFTQLNIVGGDPTELTAIYGFITDVSVDHMNIYLSTVSENSGFALYSTGSPSAGARILGPLTSGVQVWVYVTSVDVNGNESLPSAILTATPGFFSQNITCYTITDFNVDSILSSGPDAQGYYTYQFLGTWTAPSCGFTQSYVGAFVGASAPSNPDDRTGSWPLHDDSWSWWAPDRILAGKTWDNVTDGTLDFVFTMRSTSNLSGLRIWFRIWNSSRTRARNWVAGNDDSCIVM
jgi:hypothetical protein